MKFPVILLLTLSLFLSACGGETPPATVEVQTTPTSQTFVPMVNSQAEQAVETVQQSPLTSPLATPETTPPDSRRAEFPNTIIVYQREGRFPGSPKQWTLYHTGRIVADDGREWEVSAEAVAPLLEFADGNDLSTMPDKYEATAECMDCLTHTLIIYKDAEVKEIVIAQDAADLPAGLQNALNALEALELE